MTEWGELPEYAALDQARSFEGQIKAWPRRRQSNERNGWLVDVWVDRLGHICV